MTILVVEQRLGFRLRLWKLLSKLCKQRIVFARTEDEARELFSDSLPSLMVVGQSPLVGLGPNTVQMLRAKSKNVPIVFFCGEDALCEEA